MAGAFSFFGLLLTLIGATLLFFYSLPKKKIGNVIIEGDTCMQFDAEPNERHVPDPEWQPIATKFQRRAKILNSTGFALLAAGTLLQMIAIYLPTK
ncbi:hypothetical protein ACE1BU_17325 [Aeromonas veronii]|uniref:hypothetical protein n=1 Tax=Aeromonas veronii TaxID=654 RepID=UPI0035BB7A6E